jgi:uncharacterized membrane protein (DUF373 family)
MEFGPKSDAPPSPRVPQHYHPRLRGYLESTQDVIVLGLSALLLAAMVIKLAHLVRLMLDGVDFAEVISDILFVLVLVELFRLLIIYLEEHHVSVSTMVEVGIVSTLREIILKGPLETEWRQLLVLSVFIVTLAAVLRYSGIRERPAVERSDSSGS